MGCTRIAKQKITKSIIIIIIAAQFHRSAYIALSLPLVSYLFNLSKKTYIITIISIFILCFTAQNIITHYINELISSTFERYEAYSENESASLGSGIGFVFNILFFLTLVLSDRHQRSYESWTMKMLALSYVFHPSRIYNTINWTSRALFLNIRNPVRRISRKYEQKIHVYENDCHFIHIFYDLRIFHFLL